MKQKNNTILNTESTKIVRIIKRLNIIIFGFNLASMLLIVTHFYSNIRKQKELFKRMADDSSQLMGNISEITPLSFNIPTLLFILIFGIVIFLFIYYLIELLIRHFENVAELKEMKKKEQLEDNIEFLN